VEQSEIDLNEKLARWAGFEYLGMGEGEESGLYLWEYPAAEGRGTQDQPRDAEIGELPDFCNDLSACFKWLVPKLERVVLTFSAGVSLPYYAEADPSGRISFGVHDVTAALALCKAIDEMIDG